MKTKIGKALLEGWDRLLETGRLKCPAQTGIFLDLRVEKTTRGGMRHMAVLINAHVQMRGRRYMLPTQCPLSSASPAECEQLILGLIKRLRKVAKPYKKEDELKVEDFY
tara:strand:+ start:58 stop:384 length:327 start_codon:yes stop_codon:yes gene_type:complete